MNKSDQINEIAKALSTLQGEIKDAHKDKAGYNYKYADLSQVLEIVRPLLSKHGLAITQLCGSADEKVSVETMLMHTSGQWISSTIEMVAEKGKGRTMAQDVGSVISYARRYALTSLVGMTQTDNDANNVQEQAPREVISMISPQQAAFILKLIGDNQDLKQSVFTHYKVNKIEEMSSAAYNHAVERLQNSVSKTQSVTAKLDQLNAP